jgi:hypothetical protein
MTDRELLEAAAKAAGMVFTIEPQNSDYGRSDWNDYIPHANGDPWNPLTDDGDALRLAVKLKIDLLHDEPENNEAFVMAGSWDHVEGVDGEVSRLSATRRAIVRAAAAMVKP